MKASAEKHLQLFIRQITTAAANVSLYSPTHAQVINLCLKAMDELKILLADTPYLHLKLIEDRLICNDQALTADMSTERLITSLGDIDINFLSIEAGVSSEELMILAKALSKRGGGASPAKTEHISFGKLEVRHAQKGEKSEKKTGTLNFADLNDQERDKFMDICHGVRNKKKLNVVGIKEIVGRFVNAFDSHSQVLLALAPLRSMDEYVYTHSTNICLLNLAQARLLGIEGPLLTDIGIAAMLHDVGKMFISPDILNKKGKLDKDEWQIMQSHPRLGAEYLLNSPGIPRLAAVTAYEHHIGYDGKGYPSTPHNWCLNTCSYMTAISDVYDALRTRRAYKEPLPFAKISEIMLDSAGKSLHPELTSSFLSALNRLENDQA